LVKLGQILTHTSLAASGPIDWLYSPEPVAYEAAVAEMEARVAAIRAGEAHECVWLLEHPALYTAGTSAKPEDLIDAERFPVHRSGRGGQFTYHGPGQRIAYVMLDLQRRGRDVRGFVCQLEDCIISTLGGLGVSGERRQGRVGVWVARPELGPGREDKIAAIGVRIRRWVSFHGLSLNVAPDLEHYSAIVPCGITGHGVTSLAELGVTSSMDDVDAALIGAFEDVFGSLQGAQKPHSP
jgi:lipoyl(octanoyl) transferase